MIMFISRSFLRPISSQSCRIFLKNSMSSFKLSKTRQHFHGNQSPVVFLPCPSTMAKDLMELLAAATEVIMAGLIN